MGCNAATTPEEAMMSSTSCKSWRRTAKEDEKRREEELFVFGYSCKLFKDEKRARSIDEGKHLIPWMGCESLLIDRFDVRGYLQDIHLYEAKSGLLNKESIDETTEEELEIERLCDEERYADLKFIQDDDSHEEEMKRLRAALAVDGAYHEIEFNYDTCEEKEEEQVKNGDSLDNSDPYTVPPGLVLPDGVLLPETMKQHNLIEKTAKFISSHGVQMEILIKTKQSQNPLFDFLAFDSPLNPYYKFLVSAIKSGKYQPKVSEKESSEEGSEEEEEDDDDDDNYLHPSLLGTSKFKPSKPLVLPNLPRSDNETDAYSLLVKSLRDKIPVEPEPEPQSETSQDNKTNDENLHQLRILPASSQPQQQQQQQQQQNWSSLLPSPPPDIEIIIEKLAQYVAKNGEEFETTVRRRGEERFEFLNPGNMFHAHYIRKKLQYLEDKRKTQAAEHKLKSNLEFDPEKQVKVPVSFCFKEKKSSTFQGENEKTWRPGSDASPTSAPKRLHSAADNDTKKTEVTSDDKLAATSSKERLSREKQLQEERKRKAALFLSMVKTKELKVETNSIDAKVNASDNALFGPSLPSKAKLEVSNASPPRDDTQLKLKSAELSKNSAVLPFVTSDEPLKESSRSSYSRDLRSSHHRHHRHRHTHHRKYYRSRSRSRHSRSPPSRSRSKSPRTRKSRTRSRSRSRSIKK